VAVVVETAEVNRARRRPGRPRRGGLRVPPDAMSVGPRPTRLTPVLAVVFVVDEAAETVLSERRLE
jgi:hypothetical protein